MDGTQSIEKISTQARCIFGSNPLPASGKPINQGGGLRPPPPPQIYGLPRGWWPFGPPKLGFEKNSSMG